MPKEERERELKKKQWSRPKLIILTRGRPEEWVLAACKRGWGWPDGSPADQHIQCVKLSVYSVCEIVCAVGGAT